MTTEFTLINSSSLSIVMTKTLIHYLDLFSHDFNTMLCNCKHLKIQSNKSNYDILRSENFMKIKRTFSLVENVLS